MDKVLDPQIKHTLPLLNLPYSRRLVAGTGNKESTIPRKVERVDLLHVSLEKMAYAFLLDVPYLQVSFGSRPHAFRRTLICLSSAPVARYLPSGEKQILRMYKSPVRVVCSSINTLYVSGIP